ncbi:MAG: T9SS type A sorting domain-containing protein [Chlorobi bacterium]|nr:T9SS type A sorting domain-containing protein [Chlorobiota bacterium]
MKKIIFFLFFSLFAYQLSLFAQSAHTIASGNYHDPSIWDTGTVPTGSATISSGTAVTATLNVDLSAGISIDQGAAFWMTNQSSMTLSNFYNDGTFHPGDGSVYFDNDDYPYFSGVPTYFNNLYVASGDLPIFNTVTVTSVLGLDGGSALLDEGASLYIGPGGSVTATGGFNANRCVVPRASAETYGYMGRYAQSTNETLLFPVGTRNGMAYYSPVEISFQADAISPGAHFVVNPVHAKHPQNTSSTDYLQRYWEIYNQGFSNINAAVTCSYSPSDVVGNEANLWGGKIDFGGDWQRLNQADPASHSFSGSVDGFSDFTAGEFDVMPVELTSFTILYDGKVNILSWETATETNNYGFEIERASPEGFRDTPRQDEWKTIGFVEGNNTSTVKNEYKFVDDDVENGVYYYRLRQIDLDGTATYSQIINIDVGNAPKGFVLNQNYPNPFNPSTIISFGSSKRTKAELVVFDQLGRKVKTLFEGTMEANEIKKITFDAAAFSGGVYFYKLITPEWNSTKKMVLLK